MGKIPLKESKGLFNPFGGCGIFEKRGDLLSGNIASIAEIIFKRFKQKRPSYLTDNGTLAKIAAD